MIGALSADLMPRLVHVAPVTTLLTVCLLVIITASSAPLRADEPVAAERKTKAGPPFACVCLDSERVPDADEIHRCLVKWLGADESSPIRDLHVDADQPLTLSFTFDGHDFVAGLIPRPIPKADLDYACSNAFFWPEAAAATGNHRAHLIVTALGDYDKPWQRALGLSKVMAACLEAFDSVGVYWGHASVVHSPEFFLQGMREAGNELATLPVELWTGFLRSSKDESSVDMCTDGLDVFGCMEFEIVESGQPITEVFEMLISMSRYVIFNGNVIGDGDTVGSTTDEKIVTHYTQSAIGRTAPVIRIDY